MQPDILVFKGLGPRFSEALNIRTLVFVEEQNVPCELERDEFDAVSSHVLLTCDGVAVATGRVFSDPECFETARLGRVAVLKNFRGRGLGRVLIKELLRIVRSNRQYRRVMIHAQKTVAPLYAGFGFRIVGVEFFEAGILHQEMVLELV